MANDRKHIDSHISADHMLDYLNGRLSPAEAHAVERHLLDCAFCEEAMEGLESSGAGEPAIRADLETLERKLSGKTREKRRTIFTYRNYGIAASILMLIGLGLYWYAYNEWEVGNRNEIALQEEDQEVQEDKEMQIEEPSVPIGNMDTVEEAEEVTKIPEKPVKNLKAPVSARVEVLKDNQPKKMKIPEEPVEDEIAEIAMEDSEIEEAVITMEDSESKYDAGQVIPVEPEIEEPKPEPVIQAFAMDGGSADENVVSVKAAELKEVEVTKGKRRKNRERTRANAPEFASSAPLITRSATPKEGKEAYEKYLQEELKYPEEARLQEIEGTVVVSFVIDDKGKIKDLKVEKGLGHGCDEEAKRLIEKGPEWEPAMKEGRVVEERKEVEVHFDMQATD